MKRLLFIAVLFGSLSPLIHAKDAGPAAGAGLSGGATAAAKSHFRGFLEGDFQKMETSYAMRVTLMPGCEMLKPEYGLAGPEGRGKATTVDRARLIAAMQKAFGGRPPVPAAKVARIFKSLTFQALQTKIGDVAIGPVDPVGGADGKFHFTMKDGDVLIKAGPEKGDFLLFQFRQINGHWQVVAEYLD